MARMLAAAGAAAGIAPACNSSRDSCVLPPNAAAVVAGSASAAALTIAVVCVEALLVSTTSVELGLLSFRLNWVA